MKKTLVLSSILCCGLLLIIGCARNISTSSYTEGTVGSISESYPCTVVSLRKVMIEGGDSLEDNKLGMIGGALGGAAIGQAFGGGRGRVLTTAGGAALGGLGGAYAEKALKSQEGLEYTVRMQSGSLRTIVQGMDGALAPGQSALLIVSSRGRSRLVAAH
jgi:outer membrane lipoprotein SlyB